MVRSKIRPNLLASISNSLLIVGPMCFRTRCPVRQVLVSMETTSLLWVGPAVIQIYEAATHLRDQSACLRAEMQHWNGGVALSYIE